MPRSRRSPRYSRLTEMLVRARQDAGLSQVDLARRLGRPQSYVSKYESGERRLDVVEFLEATEAMGCPAIDLIASLILLDLK